MEYEYPGDKVFDKIEELCERGEEYMEQEKYPRAIKKFWKAFDLLPEPKTQYPAGTWLLTSIGDINFIVRNYKSGVMNLTRAKQFPEAEGNPYIHFRLGQCLLEEGEDEKALKELQQAYDLEGKEIFNDEDPKYWAFFSSKQ